MIKHGSKPLETNEVSLVRQLFYEIVTFFAATYDREFKMPSPPMHDPVAVAVALQPDLFDDSNGERFSVHVVREGDESNIGQCGRTVVKMLEKGSSGIRIPRALQVMEFWHLIDLSLHAAEISKSGQNH
jgi:uridine nucleosidase